MPLDDALLATLPADMNVDVDGKAVHIKDTPFLKEAKDFPSFVRGAYDAHREVGSRIPLKIDASKPEQVEAWRKDNLPKLYKAGVLQAPPASPTDYDVKAPDDIPEGLRWNEDRNKEFGKLLHKHGIPKAAAPELIEFHKQALLASADVLKTSVEEGMKALRSEHGDKYDERVEQVRRLTSVIFKNADEIEWFERVGLGNHPGFLNVMMRLAPLAMQDSSFFQGGGGGGGGGKMSGDDVKKAVADIMSNPNNPKHKLYWQKDPATLAEVEEMYKKAYGEGKVAL